jgi:ATP-binding protein involved in chromosome partitioning
MSNPNTQKTPLPGIKHVIAIASGKGGVGKSTVAANLALATRQLGLAVGLMDADIYGPSVPHMFGLGTIDQTKTPIPVERFGIKLVSMGFFVDPSLAVIWRGPKVAQAVSQFLFQPPWGELDVLFIDMPPGTGDAQLTLSQSAPITGAVIVTQPAAVSLIDARKGVRMFQEVHVPILGLIENMSYFTLPDGTKSYPLGQGGGERLAAEAGVPFLAQLPIDAAVSECGDTGAPLVQQQPTHPMALAYLDLAQRLQSLVTQSKSAAPLPDVEL